MSLDWFLEQNQMLLSPKKWIDGLLKNLSRSREGYHGDVRTLVQGYSPALDETKNNPRLTQGNVSALLARP